MGKLSSLRTVMSQRLEMNASISVSSSSPSSMFTRTEWHARNACVA